MSAVFKNCAKNWGAFASIAGSEPAKWLGRFRAEQSGNMSYLAIAGALIMMMFGGIGIDMIHAELKRTKIQNTLDRAVLAAADLENDLDPNAVVEDYFRAMQLSDSLQNVDALVTASNRRVTAEGSNSVNTMFMGMLGFDSLDVGGLATAENMAGDVEISLVLDISGSMRGSKLTQLKQGAKRFIDLVLAEGGDDSPVTVSIVPYNATVNLGPELAGYFNVNTRHDRSYCTTFDASEFNTTAISPSAPLEQLGHFSLSSSRQRDISNPWCASSPIIAHSNDPAALKAAIDGLSAGGNTAIDLGVKWGLALLDPAARPAVTAMSNDGVAAGRAAGRPANFNDNRTAKIAVIMTDGQNTTQYDIRENLKGQLSDVYLDENNPNVTSDDEYSLRVSHHYHGTSYYHDQSRRFYSSPAGGSDAQRLTYDELFARVNMPYYANSWLWSLYRSGRISYNDYYNGYYSYESIVNGGQANSRMSRICAAGRQNDVVIYTIGVEAPQTGLNAMQNCASSPAHFFDIDGDELESTFSSIASTLIQLRLTQ